jgi:hypothetical protein
MRQLPTAAFLATSPPAEDRSIETADGGAGAALPALLREQAIGFALRRAEVFGHASRLPHGSFGL